jgi:DNA-binding response OmpR family regulator
VQSSDLLGRAILVVEDEPLIALDLQTSLEAVGAKVICANAHNGLHLSERPDLSAAVLDAPPGSTDHRRIAHALRLRGVPFLFYSTHPPEDVTTVRGAPIVLKPGRPEEIIAAMALLLRLGCRCSREAAADARRL